MILFHRSIKKKSGKHRAKKHFAALLVFTIINTKKRISFAVSPKTSCELRYAPIEAYDQSDHVIRFRSLARLWTLTKDFRRKE